eukprot:COSAG01_NODE_12221_length_1777_cov_6.619785_1_plen_152_part_10
MAGLSLKVTLNTVTSLTASSISCCAAAAEFCFFIDTHKSYCTLPNSDQQVREEDVWWDILATYHDKDHRRPDITCVDPLTNTTYILDVVIAWGETMGLAADSSSRLANAKEAWKRRRYRPLILTQPSGLQGTAAECGQTGLGMEEAEAMDME